MKYIGRVIRFHRKQSGLSRAQLAEIAGVGKTLVYDIEHGKESVQFTGLKKVMDALNIKILLDSPLMKLFKAGETDDKKG
jgi:HTH-type transcriptional regulator/antitoxin HipB